MIEAVIITTQTNFTIYAILHVMLNRLRMEVYRRLIYQTENECDDEEMVWFLYRIDGD
jgi:hypothetical protein